MSPNPRRRLIYSLIGGVLIPVAFLVAFIIIISLFGWRETSAMGWLIVPLIWPIFIADLLDNLDLVDMGGQSMPLFVGLANVALYTALTYVVLLWRERRRTPRLK